MGIIFLQDLDFLIGWNVKVIRAHPGMQKKPTNKNPPKNVKVKLMFCPPRSSNPLACYYPLSRLTYLYLFIDSVRTGIGLPTYQTLAPLFSRFIEM